MDIKTVLKPGQNGTKRLTEQYGDKLICVRYRYDKRAKKRYKTVGLIIHEAPWQAGVDMKAFNLAHHKPIGPVLVRVDYQEQELRVLVKQSGGKWMTAEKAWQLPYEKAVALGLEKRIVKYMVEDGVGF